MKLLAFFVLACAGNALKITHGRIPKLRALDSIEGWDMDAWDMQVKDEIKRMSLLQMQPRENQGSLPIEKSCSSDSSYDIGAARQKIEDKAKAAIEKTSNIEDPKHADWLIVDGKIYIREDASWDILHPHKLGSDLPAKHSVPTKKKEKMRKLISSVIEQSCDGYFGDVAFNFDETSTGGARVASKGPTLAIALMKGRKEDNEILVPNLYFGDLKEWENFVQSFKNHPSNMEWENKKEQAFWRGTTTSYGKCDKPGNKERLEAARVTFNNPTDFDMQVTNENNLDCLNGEIAHHGKTHGREQMADWKYLVNLPGSQAGSYSRNINHLFLMNSVVLMWESEPKQGVAYDEWYMPALIEGETHLNINTENANDVIKDLKTHDDKARALASNACSVFEAAFSPCALTKTFHNVFKHLHEKQSTDGSLSPKELLKQGQYKLVWETSGVTFTKDGPSAKQCMCVGYDRKA